MDRGPGSGNFLLNQENLEFGLTQRGERVHDVQLPPWANSADDFVAKCRQVRQLLRPVCVYPSLACD